MTASRKLIEVVLPLDAINAACKADKSRTTGTLRNLHKWFAPMPLPAWRGLLFASLVDDPVDEEARRELTGIIEGLVANGGDLPDEETLARARRAIWSTWPEGPPTVLDPFCGGGSTLVEAQRLGCSTIGSDLNPVPVLITTFLTAMLPVIAGRPALHPVAGQRLFAGGPYEGFASDVTHYADRVLAAVEAKVGDAYESSKSGETIVAWLWARTVRCANPACGGTAPLLDSMWLSKKKGQERHVEVAFDDQKSPVFSVRDGAPAQGGTVERSGASCARCLSPIPFDHIREEGRSGRMGLVMTAVAVEIDGERIYRAAIDGDLERAERLVAEARPELLINPRGQGVRTPNYGLTEWSDLYTERQLFVLEALTDAVAETHAQVLADGADKAWADAVTTMLTLCVGKVAQFSSSQVRWYCDTRGSRHSTPQAAYGRHDLAMTWDFPEVNVVNGSSGSWRQLVGTALRAVAYAPAGAHGVVRRADARETADGHKNLLIATDPPYFGQIGYADHSDYFYYWHRRALRRVIPELYATVAAPKEGELIALASRHDDDPAAARQYFIDGFQRVFASLKEAQHPDVPMLVVYAFKEQQRQTENGVMSPGWEAILEGMVAAGLTIVGTWPIHGAEASRMISMRTNALATYVVMVCRPRPSDAPRATRADLTRLLRQRLGGAVADMQKANVAPVDLAQAVIGPGMEVYSRHDRVVETDGTRVGVARALAMINRTLAEILDEQEADLDAESRWAAAWYEQFGFESSRFGEADQLARAKGIAVDALVRAGIVTSAGSKVALIQRDALVDQWDPATDVRPTAWEAVQYLTRALLGGGEVGAAEIYRTLGGLADPARELTYRLFVVAEKTGRTDEAVAYNALVTSWSEIAALAKESPGPSVGSSDTEALF